MSKYRLGAKPDVKDERDLRFKLRLTATQLPALVDLSKNMPTCEDQGELGACTAFAIGGAVQYALLVQGKTLLNPSKLFVYYEERLREGTVNQDAGAMIRTGFKVIADKGFANEKDWPYLISRFKRKPLAIAYTRSKLDVVDKYERVDTGLMALKTALALGNPVVLGMSVYEAMMSEQTAVTGVVNRPMATEQNMGGHAVLLMGYDDKKKSFLVRNSWGAGWGKKGYFELSYDYAALGLLADAWIIKLL